jgi:EAL domain-containing protein (putative c-di-GMP-specific phosphodiesterase class I)
VNVSEAQLRQPDFVVTVLKALGPSPSRVTGIDIEITESMVAQNAGSNVQKLQRLSQIAQLPLDGLKIDRAFVAGMNISAEHMAIVSTIINLAKALRITVVAEGVETEEQASRLHSLGCGEAQGYLFTRPMPAADISSLLPPLR